MKYHEHTRVMDPAWGAGAKGREGRRGGDTAPSSASHRAPLGTPNPQHTFVLGATSPPQEPPSACIPCVLPHRPHPWVQVTWSSGTHPCNQLLSGHASILPQCRQSLVQVPRWLESCWSLLSATKPTAPSAGLKYLSITSEFYGEMVTGTKWLI